MECHSDFGFKVYTGTEVYCGAVQFCITLCVQYSIPRHSENARTNNHCPIKVRWAFSPHRGLRVWRLSIGVSYW